MDGIHGKIVSLMKKKWQLTCRLVAAEPWLLERIQVPEFLRD